MLVEKQGVITGAGVMGISHLRTLLQVSRESIGCSVRRLTSHWGKKN